jgi:hypothetical protein
LVELVERFLDDNCDVPVREEEAWMLRVSGESRLSRRGCPWCRLSRRVCPWCRLSRRVRPRWYIGARRRTVRVLRRCIRVIVWARSLSRQAGMPSSTTTEDALVTIGPGTCRGDPGRRLRRKDKRSRARIIIVPLIVDPPRLGPRPSLRRHRWRDIRRDDDRRNVALARRRGQGGR